MKCPGGEAKSRSCPWRQPSWAQCPGRAAQSWGLRRWPEGADDGNLGEAWAWCKGQLETYYKPFSKIETLEHQHGIRAATSGTSAWYTGPDPAATPAGKILACQTAGLGPVLPIGVSQELPPCLWSWGARSLQVLAHPAKVVPLQLSGTCLAAGVGALCRLGAKACAAPSRGVCRAALRLCPEIIPPPQGVDPYPVAAASCSTQPRSPRTTGWTFSCPCHVPSPGAASCLHQVCRSWARSWITQLPRSNVLVGQERDPGAGAQREEGS